MNFVRYALLRISGNVLKLPSIILSCILLLVMSLTSFWFFGWNLGCYPSADQIDQYHVLGQIRRAMRRFWIWKKKINGENRENSFLGGTPLYKPYGYVPPHRVGFLRRFGLKTGIHFAHFSLESGMVFEGTTECITVCIVSISNWNK